MEKLRQNVKKFAKKKDSNQQKSPAYVTELSDG